MDPGATQRYNVGEVARLAGVTVRTLHHYGEIGLLRPSSRSGAGYRQYSAGDLDRLTRILYYRDLGFALDAIATLLDGSTDPVEHLKRQHRLLTERLERVHAMVVAIEKEMDADMNGSELTAEDKLEIFGDTYDPAYEWEAERRWGDTEQWRQSRERTRKFTKADWVRIKSDTDALNARLVDVFTSGAQPGGAAANAAAEEHLAALNVFYDCDHDQQRRLADMYLADERFSRTYEALATGLTQWLRDSVHANADQADADRADADRADADRAGCKPVAGWIRSANTQLRPVDGTGGPRKLPCMTSTGPLARISVEARRPVDHLRSHRHRLHHRGPGRRAGDQQAGTRRARVGRPRARERWSRRRCCCYRGCS